MSVWPDYDLDHPERWYVMDAPPLDSQWIEQLDRIGGQNPFGESNLVARWGATYADPMSMDGGLKYWLANKERTLEGFAFTDPVTGMELMVAKMEDVPPAILVAVPKYSDAIQLGERRWIIEQWRSQEFLTRSGRYTEQSTVDSGESQDFVFCRNCHAEMTVPPDGNLLPCPACQSRRYYVKTEREDGYGRLLKTDTSRGSYDFFLRLENGLGQPMEADNYALHVIDRMWSAQKNKSRKEKLYDMVAETERQAATNAAATSPSNPFGTPAVPGW